MSVVSYEAINFQPLGGGHRTLATDMTAVFQKIIDYRDSIEDPADRVESVMDFFMKKAGLVLLDVIHYHTGLFMNMRVPRNLYLNFAVIMDLGEDTGRVIDKYSGLPMYPTIHTKKELDEFSAGLDKKTGKMNPETLAKFKFKTTLIFDVYTAFLIQDVGAKACQPFTAEEVTAVILHEVGHCMSFIEHASDAYYIAKTKLGAIQSFFKNGDRAEVLKFLAENCRGDRFVREALQKVSKMCQLTTERKASGSLGTTVANVVIDTLFMLLNGTISILGFVFSAVLINAISIAFIPIRHLLGTTENKSSDYAYTHDNPRACEVYADQYVSRFGYGNHFVTQMTKLMDYTRITGLGNMSMKQYGTASFYGRLLPWYIMTMFTGDDFSPFYPTERERYEIMMHETIAALKDSGLDAESIKVYTKVYQDIRQKLDNPSAAQKWVVFWNAYHRVLEYLVNTPDEILYGGRFDREYEILTTQVKRIINNEMYAMGRLLGSK